EANPHPCTRLILSRGRPLSSTPEKQRPRDNSYLPRHLGNLQPRRHHRRTVGCIGRNPRPEPFNRLPRQTGAPLPHHRLHRQAYIEFPPGRRVPQPHHAPPAQNLRAFPSPPYLRFGQCRTIQYNQFCTEFCCLQPHTARPPIGTQVVQAPCLDPRQVSLVFDVPQQDRSVGRRSGQEVSCPGWLGRRLSPVGLGHPVPLPLMLRHLGG